MGSFRCLGNVMFLIGFLPSEGMREVILEDEIIL